MTLSEIRKGLVGYWSQNYITTPTIYPNSKVPDELLKENFVALLIDFTNSEVVGNGGTGAGTEGTLTRRYGMLSVVIFCRKESGTKTIYEIADEAVELLERKRIATSIVMRASHITDIKDNKEYYTMTVEVPFKTSV